MLRYTLGILKLGEEPGHLSLTHPGSWAVPAAKETVSACPTLLAQPAPQGPVWVWEDPQMAQGEAQKQQGPTLFGVLMF